MLDHSGDGCGVFAATTQMLPTERSKIQDQGLIVLVSSEASLPGVQMAAFLLNPQKALKDGQLELSYVSSYKDTSHTGLMPHSDDLI